MSAHRFSTLAFLPLALLAFAGVLLIAAPAVAQAPEGAALERSTEPLFLRAERVDGVGAVLIPEPVAPSDMLDRSQVDAGVRDALEASPLPALVLPRSLAEKSVAAVHDSGYTFDGATEYGDFHVSATLTVLDRVPFKSGERFAQPRIDFPFTDTISTDEGGKTPVLLEVLGHGTGFDAQWYAHGTLYLATLHCGVQFVSEDEPKARACRAKILELVSRLGVAPAGNVIGQSLLTKDGSAGVDLRVLREGAAERAATVRESTEFFAASRYLIPMKGSHWNTCGTTSSSQRSGFSYHGNGCVRQCDGCADAWNYCSGSTITASCNSGKTGKGSTDTYQVSGLAFPIPEGNAYAESVYYAPGGGGWYQAQSVSSAPNFTMPWEDNFCEYRGWSVPKCNGGKGHQGQDIHASDGTDNKWWVIAPNTSTVNSISTSDGKVDLVTTDGQFLYRNLHTDSRQVSTGQAIHFGQRLAKVGDWMSGINGGTLPHLHFELWHKESGVWVRRSPYKTLIKGFEARWRVQNMAWDNNGSTCRYGYYHDFDFARRVLENRNNNCGSSTYRANGTLNTSYGCTSSNRCERVYFDAKSGSPNTSTSSFDPKLTGEWVGDGRANKSDRIYQVQYDLYKAGYNPSWNLDSLWGSTTKGAVKDFQSCNGLGADGVVGTSSWSEMASPNTTASECGL